MSRDYWIEIIEDAANDCLVNLSKEQIECFADWVRISHENYEMAFHQPESPYTKEIEDLKNKLKHEQDKIVCPQCNGKGTETIDGPYHSSTSQCWECRGEGKIHPSKL